MNATLHAWITLNIIHLGTQVAYFVRATPTTTNTVP